MKKIVFFGTAGLCLPFLEVLKDEFELPLLVTQPDTFGGRNRKQKIVPQVKTFALENGIEVLQPENLKEPAFMDKLKEIDPDIGIVIAYGKLIPARVFKTPKHRMVNVHFSLLPQYRGAAPVQRALENGDTITGISIFELVKRMDAGPVWGRKEFEIEPEDTTASMWKRLSEEGTDFLVQTVNDILDGKIEKIPQDESRATYAPPLKKEEGKVDWNLSAQQLYNRYRAYQPWPGLFCEANGKLFKLTDIHVSTESHNKEPGTVLEMNKKLLKIACAEGSVLEILNLQPPGKKPMTAFCYCLGNQLPEKLC